MVYTWQDCFRRRSPNREKIPAPLRTDGGIELRGIDLLTWGGHRGLMVGVFTPTVDREVGGSNALCRSTLTFPPVVHDWVGKGFGMSSLVCATGLITDPVPLIDKSGASCPDGRFPLTFIHQVIIITGLNELHDCMTARPEDGLRCRQGVKLPLKLQTQPKSVRQSSR